MSWHQERYLYISPDRFPHVCSSITPQPFKQSPRFLFYPSILVRSSKNAFPHLPRNPLPPRHRVSSHTLFSPPTTSNSQSTSNNPTSDSKRLMQDPLSTLAGLHNFGVCVKNRITDYDGDTYEVDLTATKCACDYYHNRNTGSKQWDQCPDCTFNGIECNSAAWHLGGDEVSSYFLCFNSTSFGLSFLLGSGKRRCGFENCD